MSSISAISKYFRVWLCGTILSQPESYLVKFLFQLYADVTEFWLGVTVYMLRHLYARYCPGQNHILICS